MRIDYILKARAKRMNDVYVNVDHEYCTVEITTRGQDSIFMQGDDAENFIAECEKISNRCKCLNFDVIELAVAEHYVECIWG